MWAGEIAGGAGTRVLPSTQCCTVPYYTYIHTYIHTFMHIQINGSLHLTFAGGEGGGQSLIWPGPLDGWMDGYRAGDARSGGGGGYFGASISMC